MKDEEGMIRVRALLVTSFDEPSKMCNKERNTEFLIEL
jgi:hypothetical protein